MKVRLAGVLFAIVPMLVPASAFPEDGYNLWLRYPALRGEPTRHTLKAGVCHIRFEFPGGREDAIVRSARSELETALPRLLGRPATLTVADGPGIGSDNPEAYELALPPGEEDAAPFLVVRANATPGILYGSFALLRHLQTRDSLDGFPLASEPRIDLRLLNHWDNLDRTVERGTAGFSLWEWFQLPDYVNPRYRDYARACASIGINGTVLTNVNANALILTSGYLEKVAALADVFRPYNLRVYLTARFSAPMEIGGLETADPRDEAVQAWWQAKATEIYHHIPDFGGFLVKANSEGQPGPQDYGRSHAEGANLLAGAVAPYGGVVLWRAFVYNNEVPVDRAMQAYNEFTPLDGKFLPNVIIQVKNGPIDFMPREPFHPLFGAMPETPLALELQITQEYLGASVHLAYLGTLFEEVLDADTHARGPGSTVGRVVDGSLEGHALSAIAGVANSGTVRNWTGHPMAAANWYAFGRLAWDHTLDARTLAGEWTRMTFSTRDAVVEPVVDILMESREAVVNYMMPLGLHHIMAWGHHYGPGPWVSEGRSDWTSVYYHRADREGIGFDRSPRGSNAVSQYAPEVAQRFGSRDSVPLEFLLWFHHVPWDYQLPTGTILWDELAMRYQKGVETVQAWQDTWDSLRPLIDDRRWQHVRALLKRQEREARWWRDACLLYFQTFSGKALPEGVEAPEHDLEYYQAIDWPHFPGNPG